MLLLCINTVCVAKLLQQSKPTTVPHTLKLHTHTCLKREVGTSFLMTDRLKGATLRMWHAAKEQIKQQME